MKKTYFENLYQRSYKNFSLFQDFEICKRFVFF